MRLRRLAIRDFRNLGTQDLELPAEGLALVGDNAQGKSNFLEAIYYLETFRSFRGARDDQLVAFGEELFRVAGTTESDGPDGRPSGEIAAAFERRRGRKKVTVDGGEPGRMGEAIGSLAAVIFSPSDIALVSGGPKERRRFLDIVLSLNQPGYLSALQDYRRILTRRNRSLKEGLTGAAVYAWDPGLMQAGAEVMWARRSWVEGRSEAFGDYYKRLSTAAGARMLYRPGIAFGGATTESELLEAFRDALVETSERERRVGSTLVGPHRDDVQLEIEDGGRPVDLREYGSGGQLRTAALALKLVEACTIRDRRSRAPLILLDDVFAELDDHRSERVLALMELEETGQVVVTAPKNGDVRIRSHSLPRWRIEAGRIVT